MALILNIETATQVCSVGLSEGADILSIRESHEKNIHAAKVTVFSEEVLKEAGKKMNDLDAVAVSMGPGSYTGLRIGVSAVKGFCYALDIPMIAVPSLQSMALRASEEQDRNDALFCPMIDARRMEVYTSLYDHTNQEVKATEAMIIDEQSFEEELKDNTIFFFGDGAAKCREVLEPRGMKFMDGVYPSASFLAQIAFKKFEAKDFVDVAYFEPYYLKDFVATIPKKNIFR